MVRGDYEPQFQVASESFVAASAASLQPEILSKVVEQSGMHYEGGIFGAAQSDQAVASIRANVDCAAFGAEPAEDHIEDRAVHPLAT